MTKKGHKRTAFGAGMIAAAVFLWIRAPAMVVWFAGLAAALSVTLPDKSEIAFWFLGRRYSLIPHRTITHWLLGWVLILLGSVVFSHYQSLVAGVVGGISVGALTHIGFDYITWEGVAFWHPFRKKSARWIKSGQFEFLLPMVFNMASMGFLLGALHWSGRIDFLTSGSLFF